MCVLNFFFFFILYYCRRLVNDVSSGEMINKVARSNSSVETAGVKTLRDMIAFLYMPPLDKKSKIFFFILCFQPLYCL